MTTNHLTTDQLSALVDGALAPRALEEAERHLASCAECRGALAALSAQGEALRRTLAHDPGEAYFESFADRVGDRIRAEGLAGAQRRGAAEPPSVRAGWGSPRSLAWLGAVAAVVVGVGIAFMVSREPNVGALRDQRAIERATRAPAPVPAPADQGKLESAPAVGAKQKAGTPPARAKESEAVDEKSRPSSEAGNAVAPPAGALEPQAGAARLGRAQEVRRDERGEDVPVTPQRGPAALFARPPAPESAPLKPGEPVYVKKHAPAVPMKVPEPQATDRLRAAPDVARAPSAEVRGNESSITTRALLEKDAERAPLCGEVRDPAGRPIANATVVLAETGALATTDASGRFCIAAPGGGRTLSVLAVGFGPVRQPVGAGGGAAQVSVVLQPVSVLGFTSLKALGGTAKGGLQAGDDLSGLPDSLRITGRAARLLTESASRLRSAEAWEAAAEQWARLIAARPGGSAGAEATFQLANASFQAWALAPSAARRVAAARAIEAYLAGAGPGARRDQARSWQERLGR
jgi:hypothetical protein